MQEQERMARLLRVATCLAASGHVQQVGALAATARAFRADAQLWAACCSHRGPRGRTRLMHAAKKGDADRARFLLCRGAAVDTPDERGSTALLFACKAGHVEVVRCLVERGGANVNAARTGDLTTPLIGACQGGHLEVVRFLVEYCGASVDQTTSDGYTALMWASHEGDKLDIVRFLVERGGANVNAACTTESMTSLMWASLNGDLLVASYLLKHGASPTAQTTCGASALTWACFTGRASTIPLLFACGADLDSALTANNPTGLSSGMTPLMVAASNDSLDCVKTLLQLKANKLLKCAEGKTAYDHASSPEIKAALTR